MSDATFTIRDFGDGITSDLYEQLVVINELGIGYLELSGASMYCVWTTPTWNGCRPALLRTSCGSAPRAAQSANHPS